MEHRSPSLSRLNTELLCSEFLGNGKKTGRLNSSHSIKIVALKLSTRGAEEQNSLHQIIVYTLIHTVTPIRQRGCIVRSTRQTQYCSLSHVTGFVALAKADLRKKDNIQIFVQTLLP